jgi:hypothetical protein
MQSDIHPFKVNIAQDVLDDIQAKLARARYPTPLDLPSGQEWSYGAPEQVRDVFAFTFVSPLSRIFNINLIGYQRPCRLLEDNIRLAQSRSQHQHLTAVHNQVGRRRRPWAAYYSLCSQDIFES